MTDVEALLEALECTGYDQVTRWPEEHEGWQATLTMGPDSCLCEGDCFCCDPINITAQVADLIDPPEPPGSLATYGT